MSEKDLSHVDIEPSLNLLEFEEDNIELSFGSIIAAITDAYLAAKPENPNIGKYDALTYFTTVFSKMAELRTSLHIAPQTYITDHQFKASDFDILYEHLLVRANAVTKLGTQISLLRRDATDVFNKGDILARAIEFEKEAKSLIPLMDDRLYEQYDFEVSYHSFIGVLAAEIEIILERDFIGSHLTKIYDYVVYYIAELPAIHKSPQKAHNRYENLMIGSQEVLDRIRIFHETLMNDKFKRANERSLLYEALVNKYNEIPQEEKHSKMINLDRIMKRLRDVKKRD